MDNDKPNFFDDQKKKIALEWLEKKWPASNQTCEICGNSTWSLAADIIVPLPYVAGQISLGGRSYPQVMLICSDCGNTKYFNAVTMGVLPGVKDGE